MEGSHPGSKRGLPLDKRSWHPSPLSQQVVVVTTRDESGVPNLAPKSWLTMVALDPPVIGFGCNLAHVTYRNARATGELVVNFPPAQVAERVWALIDRSGTDRVEHGGFTLAPATKVACPILAESRAHFECVFEDERRFGEEVFIFARMVAASIDEACTSGSVHDRYEALAPFFFLEDGTYAPLGDVRRVASRGEG